MPDPADTARQLREIARSLVERADAIERGDEELVNAEIFNDRLPSEMLGFHADDTDSLDGTVWETRVNLVVRWVLRSPAPVKRSA